MKFVDAFGLQPAYLADGNAGSNHLACLCVVFESRKPLAQPVGHRCAASGGKFFELRETRNGQDPRHNRRIDTCGSTAIAEVQEHVCFKKELRDGAGSTGIELALQFLEAPLQHALAGGLHALNDELIVAASLVETDAPESEYAIAVLVADRRATLSLPEPGGAHLRGIVLQALYPVPESLSDLSRSVQDAYETYRTRAYMRSQIKLTFALSLSLVLALGLFAAAWAAVFTARRLVQPISDIAEGTRAVAEGDYDKQLPMPRAEDEIGFLVSSFNAMTRRIARARNALEDSRRELLTQHNYLETVLAGLSTGVMALDIDGTIRTANPAADQIFGMPVSEVQKQLAKF